MSILERALRMGEAKQFKAYSKRVERINTWEPELLESTDDELREQFAELRERARAAAGKVAIADKLKHPVSSLSHGEHRQVALAMALASEPKILMLDEPASGLSRGERTLLTDLLLALDRTITLILIEHDMDVALRVAERVTMMHDGRAIVEGTPDEIRSNELVHDLYLGTGFRNA